MDCFNCCSRRGKGASTLRGKASQPPVQRRPRNARPSDIAAGNHRSERASRQTVTPQQKIMDRAEEAAAIAGIVDAMLTSHTRTGRHTDSSDHSASTPTRQETDRKTQARQRGYKDSRGAQVVVHRQRTPRAAWQRPLSDAADHSSTRAPYRPARRATHTQEQGTHPAWAQPLSHAAQRRNPLSGFPTTGFYEDFDAGVQRYLLAKKQRAAAAVPRVVDTQRQTSKSTKRTGAHPQARTRQMTREQTQKTRNQEAAYWQTVLSKKRHTPVDEFTESDSDDDAQRSDGSQGSSYSTATPLNNSDLSSGSNDATASAAPASTEDAKESQAAQSPPALAAQAPRRESIVPTRRRRVTSERIAELMANFPSTVLFTDESTLTPGLKRNICIIWAGTEFHGDSDFSIEWTNIEKVTVDISNRNVTFEDNSGQSVEIKMTAHNESQAVIRCSEGEQKEWTLSPHQSARRLVGTARN